MSTTSTVSKTVHTDWLDDTLRRLAQGERVSRALPTGGRIHVDRSLPFLIVHRAPPEPDPGTDRLITSHPAYVLATGQRGRQRELRSLIERVVETLSEQFGAFLVLEIWSGRPAPAAEEQAAERLKPAFRIHSLEGASSDRVLDTIENELNAVKVSRQKADVRILPPGRCAPPGMSALVSPALRARTNCHGYGLEVRPVYRDAASDRLFPAILRRLRHDVTRALRRALYEFSIAHTTHRPPHYHALGRRALTKAVWETDRCIAEVCDDFDFLLLVTPVNSEEAWRDFRRRKYQRAPSLHYRPVPTDEIVLKRRLYRTPAERIEDPALGQLFREKIEEVDRQITMLHDRNTTRFLQGSIQVYGPVDVSLVREAQELLEKIPAGSHRASSGRRLDAETFAARARKEIASYRRQMPGLKASVEIRPDVSSVMVSRGNLLVGSEWKVQPSRVEALIQHEVGTHVLTYLNGRAQPFRQMYSGFAGYEALQEGLAVLAEYLVGGLSKGRLRLLAARVVSVDALIRGATFVETFRLLHDDCGLPARTAFHATVRTHRGGGLTKDAVYLQGLRRVLDYLKKGGALEHLFMGKIAARHLEIVRELQWRQVLQSPPLVPSYLEQDETRERLAGLRLGKSLPQLVERKTR